jgi:diguanylate cyclase (GGDEF)-like protein
LKISRALVDPGKSIFMRLLPASLRTQMLLLILLAVLPPIALMTYTAVQQRISAERAASSEALRLARLIGAHEDQRIEGARLLLEGLARLPEVQRHDPTMSRQRFEEIVAKHQGFETIALASASGQVLAAAGRSVPASVAGTEWFTRAVATRRFVVGGGGAADSPGAIELTDALPLTDAGGKLHAVLFATPDQTWLRSLASELALPASASVLLLNRDGRVLARYPESPRFPVRSIPRDQLERMRLERGGVAVFTGKDGVERLSGFEALESAPDDRLFVQVGLSRSATVQRAQKLFIESLAFLLALGLVTALAAWRGARRLVLRRLDALLNATRRLAAGDFTVRTGLPYGNGELSELSRAFDAMAETLQQHRTEREELQHVLLLLSLVDELTGLYNRRGFMIMAQQQIDLAERSHTSITLVFADVDQLKWINDTFGHAEGDEALREASRILKQTYRRSDVVARLGGDEFVVLAVESSGHGSEDMTDRVFRKLAAERRASTGSYTLSLTLGRVRFDPDRHSSIEELLAEGDSLMYAQKRFREQA